MLHAAAPAGKLVASSVPTAVPNALFSATGNGPPDSVASGASSLSRTTTCAVPPLSVSIS